jgi:hypothetical protein
LSRTAAAHVVQRETPVPVDVPSDRNVELRRELVSDVLIDRPILVADPNHRKLGPDDRDHHAALYVGQQDVPNLLLPKPNSGVATPHAHAAPLPFTTGSHRLPE